MCVIRTRGGLRGGEVRGGGRMEEKKPSDLLCKKYTFESEFPCEKGKKKRFEI